MKPSSNKNTSVFLARDLSRAEAQRRGVCVDRKKRIDRKAWKPVKLGDVLKVCHGRCQHSVESKAGKYPILATSGEIGRTDQFLYDKPSVLIGRKGTIDKPQYIDTPFWTIDTLFYTKIADGYSPKFMFYLCQMVDWASLNEASGVPSLSANRIEALEVCVPQDFDKQLRIVKSLDAVESHINTLQALISKYEAIKKATVNLLLKQKQGWRNVKLGDVLKVCHGKCQHLVESEAGLFPILATSGEIGRANQFLYDKPSVLIGRKGTIDKPQYIETPFWTIDTLFYTKIADGYIPKFVFYLCKTIDWASLNEASGVPSLSANRIESIEVCVPQNMHEQKRIVAALDSIYNTLNGLKTQLEKSQAIKQGMMSYFFG